MKNKQIGILAAFTLMATLGMSDKASALISFSVSTGIGSINSGTVGDQGAYSSNAGTFGYGTVNFNDLTPGNLADPYIVPGATFDTIGPVGLVKVASPAGGFFSPGLCSGSAPCSNIPSDGELVALNESNYLSINEGGILRMTMDKTSNYIGFNWGWSDADNVVVQFESNGNSVGRFTASQIFSSPDAEETGFVEFTAAAGYEFDYVSFSQQGGGGFEIDNITYVPEPLTIFSSLMALGFAGVIRRQYGTSED